MKFLQEFMVLCVLILNFIECRVHYKVAVAPCRGENYPDLFQDTIHKASTKNADLLLLPAIPNSLDSYDELVKTISSSARQGGLYIISHLYEGVQCASRPEVTRSTLVFDRSGHIINLQRKPLNPQARCNITSTSGVFATDFGVTFRVVMEDELLLKNMKLRDMRNFVVVGGSDIHLFGGKQFPASWAYINNVNVITSGGVFAGRAGWRNVERSDVMVIDMKDNLAESTAFSASPTSLDDFLSEDLHLASVKPMNEVASVTGYEDTVCQDTFCCRFYIKTANAAAQEHSYGLAAALMPDGGARVCAVLACANQYKRSCVLRDQDSSQFKFEDISISSNFSSQSSIFPILMSSVGIELPKDKFGFDKTPAGISEEITLRVGDVTNILALGILERDYSIEIVSEINLSNENRTEKATDVYDYILNDDVVEFFDYLWIRLRILLFVVSVYFLEMM